MIRFVVNILTACCRDKTKEIILGGTDNNSSRVTDWQVGHVRKKHAICLSVKAFFCSLFVPFLHSVLTYWILFIRPFSGLRSYFRMYSYSSYKSSSQRSLWAKIKGSFDNFFPYSAIFWEHFALLTVSSLGGMLVSGEYAYYFYKIVQWTMLFQTLEYFYW